MQQIAWVTSITLMSGVAAVFIWVVLSNRTPAADYASIVEKGYAVRKVLFGTLLAVITVASAATLGHLPYAQAAQDNDIQVIDALGYQWYWELSRTEVKAGKPVRFRVSAADVTHGFGIYDANLTLVTQTQAMPGYTNVLNHTFDKPGVYRVLCLEYCGVSHHGMMTEITVTN